MKGGDGKFELRMKNMWQGGGVGVGGTRRLNQARQKQRETTDREKGGDEWICQRDEEDKNRRTGQEGGRGREREREGRERENRGEPKCFRTVEAREREKYRAY